MGFLFSGCPAFKGAVNTVDSQTFWNRPTSEGHSALGGRGDRGGGARVWEAPWGCVGAQKGPHLRGSLRLDSSLCSGCSPRSQGSPTVGGRPSWRSDCTKPAGFALWFLMEPAAESPGHGDPDSKGPRVGSMKVWFQPPCGCRSLRQVAWAWGWCRPWWWLRGQEPPTSGAQSRRGWAPLGLGVETTRLGHGGSKVLGAMGLENTSSLLLKVLLILSVKFPCTTASGPRPRTLSEHQVIGFRVNPRSSSRPRRVCLVSTQTWTEVCLSSPSPSSEMLCTRVIVFRLDICTVPFVQIKDSNLCPHFAIQKFPWMGTL